MNDGFILLLMIFLHIVDDYCLQGILASMKQKEWWKSQKEYKSLYKYDYIVALIMHSFSWTFMVMLPLISHIGTAFYIVFFANVIIHGVTDNLKANEFKINLVQDQTIHLIQIIVTFIILKFI